MARTVDAAAHQRRRNEFLDAAYRLIEDRGYERMSVQNVLDETGASRGAFYHYFDAKQDLLSAVVDRFADTIVARIEPIVAAPGPSPMEQLRQVCAELSARDGQQREGLVATLRVWYSEGNALVRQRFRTVIIDRLTAVLTPVIERGERDGVFAVPDAQRTALILATLLQDLNDALADQLFVAYAQPASRSTAENLVESHVWAIERVLGVPDGSTTLIDKATLLPEA